MRLLSVLFLTVACSTVILCEIDIDALGQYPPYLPKLTTEICRRRPKIEHLRLWSSSIETIEDGALHDCRDVQNIWLEQNYIKRLKAGTFLNKNEVKEINLRRNGLEYIEEGVFHDLPKLASLVLNCNKLYQFTAQHINNVPVLRSIFIDGNQLLDIDTQGILAKAPMFGLITLNSTLIQCSRLIQIARTLDSAGKRMSGMGYCETEFLHPDLTSTRVYLSRWSEFFGTSNYVSYSCIPDDKWDNVASIARADYQRLKSNYVG